MMGSLVVDIIALQAPKSRVPTFPRQIVFVTDTSTPHYRHTEKGDFVPNMNDDVLKHADETNLITRVIYTCRCVR